MTRNTSASNNVNTIIPDLISSVKIIGKGISIPVQKETSFDQSIPKILQSLQHNTSDQDSAKNYALLYFMGIKWTLHKAVYAIHPMFQSLLVNTEDDPIDTALFSRMPFPSFIISLAEPRDGFTHMVVYTEKSGSDLLLGIILFGKDTFSCRTTWIYNNCTFSESIRRGTGEAVARTLGLQNASQHQTDRLQSEFIRSTEEYQDYFLQALSICYYLCAVNAEIRHISIPKHKRPQVQVQGKFRPVNIQKYEIGYVIGRKYESLFKCGDENTSVVGNNALRHIKQRPHVRRAHWHRYWCGPGDSKHLELRWLEPVFVLGTPDTIPITERPISGELA